VSVLHGEGSYVLTFIVLIFIAPVTLNLPDPTPHPVGFFLAWVEGMGYGIVLTPDNNTRRTGNNQ
jgi:hypothetical protein